MNIEGETIDETIHMVMISSILVLTAWLIGGYVAVMALTFSLVGITMLVLGLFGGDR
jgi:hypothetical protein